VGDGGADVGPRTLLVPDLARVLLPLPRPPSLPPSRPPPAAPLHQQGHCLCLPVFHFLLPALLPSSLLCPRRPQAEVSGREGVLRGEL
jgi:hypothetical protein